MKLEVYVMAWWQTQQNIQSLSIPTKYEVRSLCDGLVTDTTKHPIIKYPHKNMKSMYGLVKSIIKYPHKIWMEVYVMAWWQTQQNIQSLSIPTKYEVRSLCDGLVTDTTKHPIIKYPHKIWS